MIGIKDLLAILDKWPAWKRITEAPERLNRLEKRLDQLEDAEAAKPVDTGFGVCEHCGKTNLDRVGTVLSTALGRKEFQLRDNKCRCNDCGEISIIQPPEERGRKAGPPGR